MCTSYYCHYTLQWLLSRVSFIAVYYDDVDQVLAYQHLDYFTQTDVCDGDGTTELITNGWNLHRDEYCTTAVYLVAMWTTSC